MKSIWKKYIQGIVKRRRNIEKIKRKVLLNLGKNLLSFITSRLLESVIHSIGKWVLVAVMRVQLIGSTISIIKMRSSHWKLSIHWHLALFGIAILKKSLVVRDHHFQPRIERYFLLYVENDYLSTQYWYLQQSRAEIYSKVWD